MTMLHQTVKLINAAEYVDCFDTPQHVAGTLYIAYSASYLHLCASVTELYNLTLVKGQ